MTTNVILRADATPRMGTGHVMRCLALAQAAQEQGLEVLLVGRVQVPWVSDRLEQEKVPFCQLSSASPESEAPDDLLRQLENAGGKGTGWVVLDGYHFGPICHQAVIAAGYRLLLIDDYNHLSEYYCDILLNQNIGSVGYQYKGRINTTLLGPEYALLRKEFIQARQSAFMKPYPEIPTNLLLTLGGGNHIASLRILVASLKKSVTSSMHLKCILGDMPPEETEQVLEELGCNTEILPCVKAMEPVLQWADLAITAGGSTCWELCCLGVPFAVIPLADNQQRLAQVLWDSGIAWRLEDIHTLFSKPGSLEERGQAGRRLVDGQGALTVASLMDGCPIYLRRARLEDSDFLLKVVNHPSIMQLGGLQHIVSLSEHEQWFKARLTSPHSFIYLVFSPTSQQPIGYIRFEEKDSRAVLSVALLPEWQNKGLGKPVISLGCQRLTKESAIKHIIANVRPDNVRAARTFRSLGFQKGKDICSPHNGTLLEFFLSVE